MEFFSVEPHEDRWAVVCGGDVLMTALSRRDAERAAEQAFKIMLTPTQAVRYGRVAPETRSFAKDREDG